MYLSHTRLLRTACSRICAPLQSVRAKRSKLLLQASLRRSSGLFSLGISLIPGCSALRAPATFKSIRNPLIFLRKMATYSCFWRAKRSKLLLQASLRRSSGLFPLVLCKQRLDLLKYLAVCLDLILISDHTYRASLKNRLRDRCKGADIFHSRI